MKRLLVMTIVLAAALTAYAQPAKEQSELEIAIQNSMRDVYQVPKDMLLIAESNKKLAMSNQAQTDTLEMLKKQANKLQYEDAPAIDRRIDEIQEKARRLLAGGCAAESTTDAELARRCNTANDEMRKERDAIKTDQENLRKKAAWIGEMRQAVYDTTLRNAAQQKKNNADYNDLLAKQKELYAQVITRSMGLVKSKAVASQACKSLSPLEKASCCLSVVSDGRNPAQCDVELLFKLFENAGVFRSTEVKPENLRRRN